jgi:hypothetical protein
LNLLDVHDMIPRIELIFSTSDRPLVARRAS